VVFCGGGFGDLVIFAFLVFQRKILLPACLIWPPVAGLPSDAASTRADQYADICTRVRLVTIPDYGLRCFAWKRRFVEKYSTSAPLRSPK
jgi:hypothetical protein